MQTFSYTTKEYDVPVLDDDYETEFEVQAFLFSALRAAGLSVRGEVRWKNPATRRCCRFDLVLYEAGKATHAIEVKAAPVKHKNGAEATRQCRTYRRFGVPVTFVYGRKDAEEFVRFARGG